MVVQVHGTRRATGAVCGEPSRRGSALHGGTALSATHATTSRQRVRKAAQASGGTGPPTASLVLGDRRLEPRGSSRHQVHGVRRASAPPVGGDDEAARGRREWHAANKRRGTATESKCTARSGQVVAPSAGRPGGPARAKTIRCPAPAATPPSRCRHQVHGARRASAPPGGGNDEAPPGRCEWHAANKRRGTATESKCTARSGQVVGPSPRRPGTSGRRADPLPRAGRRLRRPGAGPGALNRLW